MQKEISSAIENIYLLTPLQEGMLFHHMMDHTSTEYVVQNVYDITGELDIELLRCSFQKLTDNHCILRTAFVYSKTKKPMQIVLKQRTVDFIFWDVSQYQDKNKIVASIIDNEYHHKFNLEQDFLLRIRVLKIENGKYKLILTYHHIIMDGWCLSLLIEELLENYLGENSQLRKNVSNDFDSYIRWLQNQSTDEGMRYWKKYLNGFSGKTEIHQAAEGGQ